MKEILLISFALGLAATLALAQGTINFGSTASAHQIVCGGGWITPPIPIGSPVGEGFTAALYWGPAGSLEASMVQLGATASVQAGTGYIVAGGTRMTGAATAEGTSATFQIRAWNGTATTYEAAISNLGLYGTTATGRTALFSNATGAPTASPPIPPAFLTGWTTPLGVWYIPEPSPFALAGLAFAVFKLFQVMRKQRT